MTDVSMLLVSLVSFATLTIGWMVLPDASKAEPTTMAAPVPAAKAA